LSPPNTYTLSGYAIPLPIGLAFPEFLDDYILYYTPHPVNSKGA
jgi:hypothetical protein